jgi:cobalamin biosynthesis protein CobT
VYGYRRRRSRRDIDIAGIEDRHDVARRIAEMMSRQRTGREAPEIAKRAGRIDRRSLARVKAGYDRPFTTRSGASPTRYKVVVILDCSGSMMGKRINDAVQLGWDFALACQYMPNVDMEVWGQGTRYFEGAGDTSKAQEKNEASSTGVREGHFIAAYDLWRSGQTKAQFKRALRNIKLVGNEDGWALDAIMADVMGRRKSNEKVITIMVSDGAPIYSEGQAALGHVRSVVQRWRRKGAALISVSVSYGLRNDAQRNMYGQSVVAYDEDIKKTVQDMAVIIGKELR